MIGHSIMFGITSSSPCMWRADRYVRSDLHVEHCYKSSCTDVFIYPLFLFQVLKFDSDRLRQNLKFCERDDVTIAPKFYFDDSEEAQSVIESLWPESSLEKNFAGNKSIKLSVTNLKVI